MTAPAQNLTARQHRLLVYLHARAPEVPSIREMSDAIGVVSSNATGLLIRLERDGWIRRARGKARAVELLRPPPSQGAADAEAGPGLRPCLANPDEALFRRALRAGG